MRKYKLKILTLQGNSLTFTVSSYKINEGHFVSFIDEVTGRKLKFHSSRVEVEEVDPVER